MATATMPTSAEASSQRAEFTITATLAVLGGALTKLLTVIPTAKASLPITASVLIEVQDEPDAEIANGLGNERSSIIKLTGTNMDATVVLTIPAMVRGHGRAALPAKRLAAIVQNLPAGSTVTMRVKGSTARITAGRTSFDIIGSDVAEFPRLEALRGTSRTTSVNAAAFVAAVTRSARVAPRPESQARAYLKAVCLDYSKSGLVAVATDSHTLARILVGDAPAGSENTQSLLSSESVGGLTQLFGDLPTDAKLSVTTAEHVAVISSDDTLLRLRLVSGRYPTYEQIIPTEAKHTIVVERESLVAAVKRADIAADNQSRRIELTLQAAPGFGGSELWSRSNSPDAGSAEDVVLVESHDRHGTAVSEPFRIGVNAGKLLLGLAILGGEKIQIEFSTPERAMVLRVVARAETDPTLVLIMPLRLF